MGGSGLHELTVGALRQGYLRRELSPVEVLAALAERVEAGVDAHVFITPMVDSARAQARWAEDLYRRGEGGGLPLLGIPLAVKDNYDTAGIRTTYGSSLFATHVPAEDAACVQRARAAGALIVGKTNLQEFAWGISGENPHYGACRNPWDAEHAAGGSSSGSAVAVASLAVPLALGSDTAGSIRIPAGFCGILGFKPTYDRLPRRGLFPLAPTLDHVGLMARAPRDLTLLLHALDDRPARGGVVPSAAADEETVEDALSGLRVGVLPAAALADLDDDVAAVAGSAADVMLAAGAELVELDAGVFAHLLHIFIPIQQAEAFFAHHARGLYPAQAREYSAEVRERLAAAEVVTLAAYLTATAQRDAVADAVRELFTTVDVLLTPLGAARTPRLAELADQDYAAAFRRRTLRHTLPQSLAGIPSCAVRAGFDTEGLPIGVQLAAWRGQDERLLAIVAAFWRRTQVLQDVWPRQ